MNKIFHVWNYAGTKYIAISCYGNWSVLTDEGDDLGSYSSVSSAKKYIKAGDDLVLGKASLVKHIES